MCINLDTPEHKIHVAIKNNFNLLRQNSNEIQPLPYNLIMQFNVWALKSLPTKRNGFTGKG